MSASTASIWDLCVLDADQEEGIRAVKAAAKTLLKEPAIVATSTSNTSASNASASSSAAGDASDGLTAAAAPVIIISGDAHLDRIQADLAQAEASSRTFVQELDRAIDRLDAISMSHDSVTSKTNQLMRNCEDLVERQKTLQETIDSIQRTLAPFDGTEEAAVLLGMPSDAYGRPIAVTPAVLAALAARPVGSITSTSSAGGGGSSTSTSVGVLSHQGHVDLRSPEFKSAMLRIVNALQFLYEHLEIHDSARLARWLFQLQYRGNSLIAKELRELLENASKACADSTSTSTSSSMSSNTSTSTSTTLSSLRGDLPLESLAPYAKFRGLGKRARELIDLLECSAPLSSDAFAELYYISNRDATSTSTGHQGSRWFSGSNMAGGGWGGSKSASITSTITSSNMDAITSTRGLGPEATLAEVLEAYYNIRTTLLNAIVVKEMRSIEASSIRTTTSTTTSTNTSTTSTSSTSKISTIVDVGHFVRQAFSLLLRLTHLEFHLFDSLFLTTSSSSNSNNSTSSGSSSTGDGKVTVVQTAGKEWTTTTLAKTTTTSTTTSTNSTTSSPSTSAEHPNDSLARWVAGTSNATRCDACISIIDTLSALISGELRAHIIHESSVDVLCRIITTLCDDIASQTAALRLPSTIIKRLETCIATSVSDALERLVYCTEVALRQEIQSFTPLPIHLNYPDILIKVQEERKAIMQSSDSSEGAYLTLDDIAKTWYPTLKSTLSLLSKLYGVVDPSSFEDFASRIIPMCTKSLQVATEKIRRGTSSSSLSGNQNANIHADFFSVRHLLILREQLTPFDMRFQIVENQLDFAPTSAALQHLVKNSRSLFKFDNSNAILQLARDGAPELRTRQVDVRRDLDMTLKDACRLLRTSAVSMLLAPLEGFLAKVTAFAGVDIPISTKGTTTASTNNTTTNTSTTSGIVDTEEVAFTPAIRATLRAQAFMKPDRIKGALDAAMETAVEKSPELRSLMLLYVDNPISRSVLVKPVQHDIAAIKQKMITVINSCVDPGQQKRDLEQLLNSVVVALTTDLSMLGASQNA